MTSTGQNRELEVCMTCSSDLGYIFGGRRFPVLPARTEILINTRQKRRIVIRTDRRGDFF